MRFLRYQLPALLWAFAIFLSSSLPARAFPTLAIFRYDKIIHFVLFGLLAIFVYRAFSLPSSIGKFSWGRALVTILLAAMYGVSDEFHQKFVPGRTPDVFDAAADTAGACAAMLLIFITSMLRHRRNTPRT